jgi:hypothetical protein
MVPHAPQEPGQQVPARDGSLFELRVGNEHTTATPIFTSERPVSFINDASDRPELASAARAAFARGVIRPRASHRKF